MVRKPDEYGWEVGGKKEALQKNVPRDLAVKKEHLRKGTRDDVGLGFF